MMFPFIMNWSKTIRFWAAKFWNPDLYSKLFHDHLAWISMMTKKHVASPRCTPLKSAIELKGLPKKLASKMNLHEVTMTKDVCLRFQEGKKVGSRLGHHTLPFENSHLVGG